MLDLRVFVKFKMNEITDLLTGRSVNYFERFIGVRVPRVLSNFTFCLTFVTSVALIFYQFRCTALWVYTVWVDSCCLLGLFGYDLNYVESDGYFPVSLVISCLLAFVVVYFTFLFVWQFIVGYGYWTKQWCFSLDTETDNIKDRVVGLRVPTGDYYREDWTIDYLYNIPDAMFDDVDEDVENVRTSSIVENSHGRTTVVAGRLVPRDRVNEHSVGRVEGDASTDVAVGSVINIDDDMLTGFHGDDNDDVDEVDNDRSGAASITGAAHGSPSLESATASDDGEENNASSHEDENDDASEQSTAVFTIDTARLLQPATTSVHSMDDTGFGVTSGNNNLPTISELNENIELEEVEGVRDGVVPLTGYDGENASVESATAIDAIVESAPFVTEVTDDVSAQSESVISDLPLRELQPENIAVEVINSSGGGEVVQQRVDDEGGVSTEYTTPVQPAPVGNEAINWADDIDSNVALSIADPENARLNSSSTAGNLNTALEYDADGLILNDATDNMPRLPSSKTDNYSAYRVVAGPLDNEAKLYLPSSLRSDTSDLLRELLKLDASIGKRSASTGHALNNYSYVKICQELRKINLQGYTVAEVGGHKGCVNLNCIRIVADVEGGDALRLLSSDWKADNEKLRNKSYKWFNSDFFEFEHRVDVIVCVFVVGMDMVRFWLHCRRLQVKHIIYVSAATPTLFTHGFMCTSISQLLTFVESGRVRAFFGESDKIYDHSVFDYFSPFVYSKIRFSDDSYYVREPATQVDSNVTLMFSLKDNKFNGQLAGMTLHAGQHEQEYYMVDVKNSLFSSYGIPVAVGKDFTNEVAAYLEKTKDTSNNPASIVRVVSKHLAERFPLVRDGGYRQYESILDDVVALVLQRLRIDSYGRRKYPLSFRAFKDMMAYLCGQLDYFPATEDIEIKPKELNLSMVRTFVDTDKAELVPLPSFEDVSRVDVDESMAHSWIGPVKPVKAFSPRRLVDKFLQIVEGGAYLKDMFEKGLLDIRKFCSVYFTHTAFVLTTREHVYCTHANLNGINVVRVDLELNVITGCYDGKNENTTSFIIINHIDAFFMVFCGVTVNHLENRCYYAAFNRRLPLSQPPANNEYGRLQFEIMDAMGAGGAILNEGCLYIRSDHGPIDSVAVVVDHHAFRLNRFISLEQLPQYDIATLRHFPYGVIHTDLAAIEKRKNEYLNIINKIRVNNDGDNAVYKMSIRNWLEYEMEREVQWLSKFVAYSYDDGLEKAKSDRQVVVFDNINGHLTGTVLETMRDIGWDGYQYVYYDKETHRFNTSRDYVITCEDLSYARGLRVVETLSRYHSRVSTCDYSRINFTFVNGVPGCGKTYTIANEASEMYQRRVAKARVLILTSSVGGKEAYEDFPWLESYLVRTYDSIIVNYKEQADLTNIHTVYCDEAMMTHYGQLLTVVGLLRPREVLMYGDNRQIPFICRVIGFKLTGHLPIYSAIKYMNHTYRSPLYMRQILLRFYPDISFESTNADGHPYVIKIHQPTLLNSSEYDAILTFTQFEKALMISEGNKNVFTIHEMQGSSYDNVAIVRTMIQDNAIYQSPQHIVVAVSRHRKLLTYFTVDDKDTLTKLLTTGKINLELDRSAIGITKTSKPLFIPIYQTKEELKYHPIDLPGIYEPLKTDVCYPAYITKLRCYMGFYDFSNLKTMELDVRIEDVNAILGTLYEPFDKIELYRKNEEEIEKIPDYLMISLSSLARAINKTDDRVYCVPKLVTPQYPIDRGYVGTLINSIKKRNGNPPVLLLANAYDNYVALVDKFMKVFVDDVKFKSLTLDYDNNTYYRNWLSSRDSTQLAVLKAKSDDYAADPNRYGGVLKPLPKPKLDNSHNESLPAPQVISSMHPYISACFAGPLKAFVYYLKASLKDNWNINDGFDGWTLSALVNNLLAVSKTGAVKVLETDISKFDKSQELGSLIVCSLLFRKFGVPDDIVRRWDSCHIRNLLVFRSAGLSMHTDYQRRSGDIMTFVGNTIVTMMATLSAFDLSTSLGGVFGGDDSIVVFDSNVSLVDNTYLMTDVFNFVTKVEHFPDSVVFASKFLIYTSNVWVLMPDALKIIIKLGRDDIRNKEHAAEYYKSFLEINALYKDSYLCSEMASRIVLRYQKLIGITLIQATYICFFIQALVLSKRKFMSLFEVTDDNSFKGPLPKNFLDHISRSVRYKLFYNNVDV